MAVDHAHVGNHASVLVKLRVEDQGARCPRRIADRRRNAADDRLKDVANARAGLRRDANRVVRLPTQKFGDLGCDAIGIRAREIDLVDDRDQLKPGVNRRIGVCDGLGSPWIR